MVTLGDEARPIRVPRKTEWLLALLVLRHNREIERDWLASTLWPDSEDDKALDNLRHELTRLRKALGSEAYRIPDGRKLRFDLIGANVDLIDFDTAIQRGDLPSLESAISLYRGPVLEGCDAEWVFQGREAYKQSYEQALETLVHLSLLQGNPRAAVRWLRKLVSIDPYRESAHRQLMEALADCGDYAAVTRAYRDLRLLLHKELNLLPSSETDALYRNLHEMSRRAILRSPEHDPSLPSQRLPIPLTELIGRDQDVEAIVGWLRKSRLVTLTGAGGVGKTRLAIAVAEQFVSAYPGGVWFVELAFSDPQDMAQTVAQTLGVKEEANRAIEETLSEQLESSRLLLVLDNCEHLMEGVALLVDRLLSTCPGLSVLATSRQVLGLAGERVYRVPSLALPQAEEWGIGSATKRSEGEKNVASLLEYGGIRLRSEERRVGK